MNYTYMKGCALCMTLCLTSAALPGRANAESSAIVNEVLQSSVVKGVVKDSNGEPLLGVNVLVKGTTIGAVTDIDGNFSFEAPAGCTLVISYIGFESQEVKVKGNAPLNIILKEDSEALDEVVVVGYGVQKKSDVTGALSSVKGDDLTKLSISRTDQALQGQMAGVMVQNSVAAPGESPNIIIRGGNSLKGENAPLVVIDGVLGGDLSLIDPNDITSIEVLKDASSTSIYGSRGANGVIMVTTKRGQTGKPTVSYSGYVSLSQVSKKMDMLNGQELYGLLKEAQEKYLDFLRDLLKDKGYIHLAYMTGILPVKKYGTHSALNMFTEYSMTDPGDLAEYFGFTEVEVKKLCERFHRNFEETRAWYDGYELVTVDGEEKICYSMYSPKSVVDVMLSGVFDNYWNQTETYEALKSYIKLNFDGLKDAIIRMLAGERVQVNIGTFSNDMTSFQGKDDVLTLLIHLGYLSYHWPDKTVTIPNKEVSQEYINAIKKTERTRK